MSKTPTLDERRYFLRVFGIGVAGVFGTEWMCRCGLKEKHSDKIHTRPGAAKPERVPVYYSDFGTFEVRGMPSWNHISPEHEDQLNAFLQCWWESGHDANELGVIDWPTLVESGFTRAV